MFFFCVFLFFSVFNTSQLFAESTVLEEVVIQSKPVRLRDELENQPLEKAISQPSGNPDLKSILERIPGVQVRAVSGVGSLMSVTTLHSMNSGASQLSVDGFPVINPVGTGFNYSLFPASLIERLESRTGLSSTLDIEKDARPAPGGRINLNTLSQKTLSAQKTRGGATFGFPNTGVAHLAGGNFKKNSWEWASGLSFFTTKGDFRFKNPSTKEVERRGHNDATGGGVILTGKYETDSQWQLSSLLMADHMERTSPGSLSYPSRDHEKDDFHMAGFQAKKQGFFSRLSANHTRTGTRSDPAQTPNTTDDRVYAGVLQAGYTHPFFQKHQLSYGADWENQRLRTNNGKFFRTIGAMNVSSILLPFPESPFTVTPLFRQEISNQYSKNDFGQRDYRLGLFYPFLEKFFLEGGGSYDHLYPDITAYHGYVSNFGLVRGNPNLRVERYRNWDLGATFNDENVKLSLNGFLHLIQNRNIFSFYSDGTSSYENISQVKHWGGMVQGQVYWNFFSLQNTVIVQQAKDMQTEIELPYKPRWQNLLSVGIKAQKNILFTAEEKFESMRRYSATSSGHRGDEWLNPWWTTNLRLDWQILRNLLCFAKVENLWERDGFEYPGFPRAGRSFFIGLTSGERI